MNAKIQFINSATGMFAARIDGYVDFVVIELLENCRLEKGDVISHPNFKTLGKQTYSNTTKNSSMKVYVQDVCSENFVLSNYKMQ